MSKKFIIEGSRIWSLESLYSEINRVLMSNENWKIAASLDAFNDLLYGEFGNLKNVQNPIFIWKNFEDNAQLFGTDFTIKWYQEKLKSNQYNSQLISDKLQELESGMGQTYFEIIEEIFKDHPNITLIKE